MEAEDLFFLFDTRCMIGVKNRRIPLCIEFPMVYEHEYGGGGGRHAAETQTVCSNEV